MKSTAKANGKNLDGKFFPFALAVLFIIKLEYLQIKVLKCKIILFEAF